MDKSLKIQAQIRHNAEEVSSYLSDLAKWESSAKQKDLQMKAKAKAGPEPEPRNNNLSPAIPGVYDQDQSKASMTNHRLPSQLGNFLTPSSIIGIDLPADTTISIPAPRRRISDKDAESIERESGNEEYQKGNFQVAIRCYTRCLGLKVGNYIAFSNRAMALLKLKEYHRAEVSRA
jgi:hypothetical protein